MDTKREGASPLVLLRWLHSTTLSGFEKRYGSGYQVGRADVTVMAQRQVDNEGGLQIRNERPTPSRFNTLALRRNPPWVVKQLGDGYGVGRVGFRGDGTEGVR
jgi:hypothetical protein